MRLRAHCIRCLDEMEVVDEDIEKTRLECEQCGNYVIDYERKKWNTDSFQG